jgi:hypothetical protein
VKCFSRGDDQGGRGLADERHKCGLGRNLHVAGCHKCKSIELYVNQFQQPKLSKRVYPPLAVEANIHLNASQYALLCFALLLKKLPTPRIC